MGKRFLFEIKPINHLKKQKNIFQLQLAYRLKSLLLNESFPSIAIYPGGPVGRHLQAAERSEQEDVSERS